MTTISIPQFFLTPLALCILASACTPTLTATAVPSPNSGNATQDPKEISKGAATTQNGSPKEEVPEPILPGRHLTLQGESFLVSDFEDQKLTHALTGTWVESFDQNNLGTTLTPHPLELAPGGPGDSKFALRIHGHFGRNVAPWPYVDVRAPFEKTDLSAFSSIRFWVKGDNKKYVLALVRTAVTDYCHYRAVFTATSTWQQIELPLDAFFQPSWGKSMPKSWQDITAFSFQPDVSLNDESFDLTIDNIELIPAAKKTAE